MNVKIIIQFTAEEYFGSTVSQSLTPGNTECRAFTDYMDLSFLIFLIIFYMGFCLSDSKPL